MTIKKNIEKYIKEETISILFKRNEIEESNFPKDYNKKIRNKLKSDEHGVYIWYADDQIIYIGKGGSINTDGSKTEHNVKKRLMASRKKDERTKQYITTNYFIKNLFLKEINWNKFRIEVFFPKKNVPVAYIESKLMFEYFTKNNTLPKLNKRY